jgi:metal-dependent amidase/aminoacylase/carboxypeptidase family protein
MTGQLPFAAALRHQIHAAPELSGSESAPAELVADAIGAQSVRTVAGVMGFGHGGDDRQS